MNSFPFEEKGLCMSMQRLLWVIGLSMLFAGCTTTQYDAVQGGTNTQKGVRYLLGRGVSQSDQKAFYHFNKGANEDNNIYAQNELAYLYAAGKGTHKDYTKALYYYQKAATRGLASAQYNLGMMYANGLGTSPNQVMARKWLEKSAALGFEPARVALEQS